MREQHGTTRKAGASQDDKKADVPKATPVAKTVAAKPAKAAKPVGC